jgi:hypothetical protein
LIYLWCIYKNKFFRETFEFSKSKILEVEIFGSLLSVYLASLAGLLIIFGCVYYIGIVSGMNYITDSFKFDAQDNNYTAFLAGICIKVFSLASSGYTLSLNLLVVYGSYITIFSTALTSLLIMQQKKKQVQLVEEEERKKDIKSLHDNLTKVIQDKSMQKNSDFS